jgi:hypothetical protein
MAAAAAQWRPWSHLAPPADQSAIYFLIFAQATAAALLCPWLLPDWDAWMSRSIEIWPILMLSGYLSGIDARHRALAGAYITLWLAALASWQWAFSAHRSGYARRTAMTLAGAWVIGGPVLLYLRAEYQPDIHPLPLVCGGPGFSAIQLLQTRPDYFHFVPLLAFLAAALLVRVSISPAFKLNGASPTTV